MRLLRTEITPLINEQLYVDLRSQSFLSSPFHSQPSFHSHPELELVFILEGFGKRIIGNMVEPFEAGDMVFIGSNVPHVWLSDRAFYQKSSTLQSKVIVVYLNPKILEQFLDSIKEFKGIKEMVQRASKGIRILGETQSIIAKKLLQLSDKTGFEKVEGLLQIMHMISISPDNSYIVNNQEDDFQTTSSDRLVQVIQFIQTSFREPISLKQVAEIACMTEQSFCRFFKSRTRKSFSQYLLDLRMDHARKLLIEEDKSISDIANLCGYNSSSHFCKVFKDHNGQSPYQFKSGITKR